MHLGFTHDLLEPKRLGSSTSWTLPPTDHSAHFTDSGRLHSIATPSLVTSWPPFKDSDPATWCQASAFLHDPCHPEVSTAAQAAPSPMASRCQDSAALHDPFVSSKPVGELGVHYTLPNSAASLSCCLGPLWTQLTLRNTPRGFRLSHAGLCLITSDFSAPADQEHILLIQTSPGTTLTESLKNSSSLRILTSQASIVCSALNIIFQVPRTAQEALNTQWPLSPRFQTPSMVSLLQKYPVDMVPLFVLACLLIAVGKHRLKAAWLTVYSPSLWEAKAGTQSRNLCKGGTTYSGLGPSTSIIIQGNDTIGLQHDSLVGHSLNQGSLFSDDCIFC